MYDKPERHDAAHRRQIEEHVAASAACVRASEELDKLGAPSEDSHKTARLRNSLKRRLTHDIGEPEQVLAYRLHLWQRLSEGAK